MTVELIEEQKVEAGLVGKDIAVVQHEVPRKLGREGRAGDADTEREGMREGTHKQLAAILKLVDWILASKTAEEIVVFRWRRVGAIHGLLPHCCIERI